MYYVRKRHGSYAIHEIVLDKSILEMRVYENIKLVSTYYQIRRIY